MKKTFIIRFFIFLCLFIATSCVSHITLFGPSKYVRTNGPPDLYHNAFSTTPGKAELIVVNGDRYGKHRVSSAVIFVNETRIFGPMDFSQKIHTLRVPISLTNKNSIYVELKGGKRGSYVTVAIIRQAEAPTIAVTADTGMIKLGESTMLSWNCTDADSCVIEPGIGSVPVDGSIELFPVETTTYKIIATGPGGTATADVTITVTYTEPSVTISTDSEVIRLGESTLLTWNSTHAQHAQIDNGIGVVSPNGSIAVSPEQNTIYAINITGPGGSANAQVAVRVRGDTEPQPEGSFGARYEDLIPPGVTIKSYDPRRFSLITGKIQDPASSPVAGIGVSIHSHPEYGEVFTDSAGRFTIPVEGGYTITVVYQKEGLITAHRKVYVSWNDISETETVQMIEQDLLATTITFDGNPNTVITHQSSQTSDSFGSRSCTMVFTGDNSARELDEAGNVIRELKTITARATEFATPESMPAKLPPNSGYTYCAEFGLDQTQRVVFDKPVITWVDNFLGFDVGEIVPVGYYDRDRGVWAMAFT